MTTEFQYEGFLSHTQADKGLKGERHEGVVMKGFPGKFTLWAVAG